MYTELSEWFEGFLNKLRGGGWSEIFATHGWDLTADTSEQTLEIDRSQSGFQDFSLEARAAIEPGDPARSLLYHAVMSPGVQKGITVFPDVADIDQLENYIYSLKPLSAEQMSDLLPAVMAYEYRSGERTPHKKHADLVFSRTGVGRVGTDEPIYSGQARCFITYPESDDKGTRAQPVRYGVFLCRKMQYNSPSVQGKKHSDDERRIFLSPVTKIFNGMSLASQKITLNFREHHINDKLKRMVTLGKLKLGQTFELNEAPFYYRSDRDDIIDRQELSGNFIVWRKPQTFCRMARQNNQVVTFKVPKENLLSVWKRIPKFIRPKFLYNNRRYTSLRVGQNSFWALADYGINSLLKTVGLDKRVFLSSRQAGEFTNIRHILDENGEVFDLNLLSIEEFKPKLSKGGYQAIMYEDPVCDGYVMAELTGLNVNNNQVKPAYSLMTAPDFMPRVGNIDIYKYEKNFVIGGPRALCEGRLPVNLRLRDLSTDKSIFSSKEQTVTAITSADRSTAKKADTSPIYNTTHYLSDEASDIFAPGWDVTYTRDTLFSAAYYHTAGLGAPFLEDVKLCAAANGMWPAASPDAARTFKRKTRTALPLTDQELGLSPESVLVQNGEAETVGWDGEYGPYFTYSDNKLVVNYASIERSDYLTNYMTGRFDFSCLRQINRSEVDARMSVLAQANKELLQGKDLDKSSYWLVSFVKVMNWTAYSTYANLPADIIEVSNLTKEFLSQKGDGYFLIFAKYSTDSILTENLRRKIQPIDSLHFVIATLGQSVKVAHYYIPKHV